MALVFRRSSRGSAARLRPRARRRPALRLERTAPPSRRGHCSPRDVLESPSDQNACALRVGQIPPFLAPYSAIGAARGWERSSTSACPAFVAWPSRSAHFSQRVGGPQKSPMHPAVAGTRRLGRASWGDSARSAATETQSGCSSDFTCDTCFFAGCEGRGPIGTMPCGPMRLALPHPASSCLLFPVACHP